MDTTLTVWIDAMGSEPSYVSVYFDSQHKAVLVTNDVLGDMIDALRRSGLFDDETTENTVEALQQAPRIHGLVDVTDLGGGWSNWQDMVIA